MSAYAKTGPVVCPSLGYLLGEVAAISQHEAGAGRAFAGSYEGTLGKQ